MKVYANRLELTPLDPSAGAFLVALDAVRSWLSQKLRRPLSREQFEDGNAFEIQRNHVQVWCSVPEFDEFPKLAAVRLTHPDREIRGREWVTEIGICAQEADSIVSTSILLQVEDASAYVASHGVRTTRPRVVEDLLRVLAPIPEQVGAAIREGDPADRDDFADEIDDSGRQYPLVLVSPDSFTERPLVDTRLLQSQVVGLAQVVVIKNKFDAYRFRQMLGSSLAAWDGAVNVIFPRRRSGFVPNKLFRAREIEAMQLAGQSVEREILSTITHASNLTVALDHVSPETVELDKLHRRLERLRNSVTLSQDAAELLAMSEEENTKLLAAARRRDAEFRSLTEQLAEKEAEIEKLRWEKEGLKSHLGKRQASQAGAEEDIPTPATLDTLAELGEFVASHMNSRLLLTNRAKKTLRDSPYRDLDAAFDAFALLYGAFHAFFSGQLTLLELETACRESGIEYTPHMSGVTLGSYVDYNARYKNRPADMNKHLKLGDSRNPERSFRVHFEWDPEDSCIVIHHAGRHPTNSLT